MDGGTECAVRAMVYCLVPRELAATLHEPLRRHFHDDPSVEVVVERRGGERRSGEERRLGDGRLTAERRRIRSESGRRVGERRAALVSIDVPALPRKARAHAGRLVFAERLEPSAEQMEDRDTARLIMRIQAGDGDAFAVLYTRYFDRLYGYMRMALRDAHEAEDATQQVFTQVLEALPGYERRSQPFRAWLFMIARNRAVDQLRKLGRLEVADTIDMRSDEHALEDDEVELGALGWITDRDLLMFIERLPLAQRQVLVLRYMLGLKTSEMAHALGRSQQDIRSLHHRGIAFLRQRLTAVRRAPGRERGIRMRRWPKPAPVLRKRRFVLNP